jgi:hypothetical protein
MSWSLTASVVVGRLPSPVGYSSERLRSWNRRPRGLLVSTKSLLGLCHSQAEEQQGQRQ